jgi:hypothetical protein
MPGFNINEFQAALFGGGARPSQFMVMIQNPVASASTLDKTPFMVQTAQIPEATLNTVQTSYFGRQIKFAGNRTFPDWTVSIINDEDFLIRDAMERWSNAINGLRTNIRSSSLATTAQYKTNATVTQFSKTGDPLRTYKFIGLFPVSVGAIALDWSSDEIERFDVTFSYDYWEAGEGVLGQVVAQQQTP